MLEKTAKISNQFHSEFSIGYLCVCINLYDVYIFFLDSNEEKNLMSYIMEWICFIYNQRSIQIKSNELKINWKWKWRIKNCAGKYLHNKQTSLDGEKKSFYISELFFPFLYSIFHLHIWVLNAYCLYIR